MNHPNISNSNTADQDVQRLRPDKRFATLVEIQAGPRSHIPPALDVDADANAICPARSLSLESILPAGEFHMLAGPSGVGKTTSVFEFCRAVRRGQTIWGYETTPQKCALVAVDRTEASYRRTCDARGFDISEIHFKSLVDDPAFRLDADPQRGNVFLEATFAGLPPDIRIVVIDPLLTLLQGDSNQFKPVAQFCIALTRIAQNRNLTIIGIIHTSKGRSRDFIHSPRERLLGSVAWSAHVETILYLEPIDLSMTTASDRRLFILPRNAPPRTIRYRFTKEGRFEVVTSDDMLATYESWLQAMLPGTTFRTRDFMDWITIHGYPKRTAESRLASWRVEGRVKETGRGSYVRV